MPAKVYPADTPVSHLCHLPAELTPYRQWVVFKLEPQPGQPKPAKVPYNPRTGRRASTTCERHWSDFKTAQAALGTGRYDGVGFVFSETDPFVGIDLDHCVELETGALERAVVGVDKTTGVATTTETTDLVGWLDSYTEYSLSGQGLHILVKGAIAGACKPTGSSFELYAQARFFALTGHRVADTPAVIAERPRQVQALYRRLKTLNSPLPPAAPAVPPPGGSVPIEDAELLKRMLASQNGAAIEALWRGDYAAYPNPASQDGLDHSSGDLGLACHLAFWCNREVARMDRLFRQSGMMRPKWDQRRGQGSYGEQVLAKAITLTPRGYRGGAR